MKYLILLIVVFITFTTAAAETVTLEIPDQYVPSLVESAVTVGDYATNALPGETQLEFAKRMIVSAIVKRHIEIQLAKNRLTKIAELNAEKEALAAMEASLISTIQIMGTADSVQ